MVFQHFALFDTLTAAENVWLGWTSRSSLAEVTRAHRARSRRVRPRRRPAAAGAHAVGRRAPARRDRARAADQPQLLILDEPTSVLTPQAVQTLFVTLRKLAARRLLDPLHQPQARRDPRAVPPLHRAARRQGHRRGRPAQGDQRQPVAPDDRRRAAAAAAPRGRGPARVGAGGARARRSPQRRPVRRRRSSAISFEVRAGEIVGIAGVSGNGQQELMAALSGEDRRAPRRHRSACSASDIARALAARAPRRWACTSCPRSASAAARCRRCSLAQNTLLTRTERASALAAGSASAHVAALADALIERFNVKAGGAGRGGAQPVGRQPAEVHRRPRDRRRSPRC